MFGRRKREEEAAAEAARESERRALFAKLAERPENICPFLGLASARTEYVEGISDEHRCFAFGDPAPLSAEQQTRVCQERGYGNCPRYLRGVLVIPTEELEALRRPHAPLPEPAVAATPPADRRRRRSPVLLVLLLALLVGGGAAAAFFALNQEPGVAVQSPTPTASTSAELTATPSPSPQPTPSPVATSSAEPTPTPSGTTGGTPTPEPTPTAGDSFAFYEVSVGPEGYTLYDLDRGGDVARTRDASFGNFSFAEVEPAEGSDGNVYWVTRDGDLAGWAYAWPQSGDFRIRAVFLTPGGDRRSVYLDDDELTAFPESTPAP